MDDTLNHAVVCDARCAFFYAVEPCTLFKVPKINYFIVIQVFHKCFR